MLNMSRGHITVNREECKGCSLCVDACPQSVLALSEKFNSHGYHPVEYLGECTGCGTCFYACPEPVALTVFKRWDLMEETAFCPRCEKENKVFREDENPEILICTSCLKPIK